MVFAATLKFLSTLLLPPTMQLSRKASTCLRERPVAELRSPTATKFTMYLCNLPPGWGGGSHFSVTSITASSGGATCTMSSSGSSGGGSSTGPAAGDIVQCRFLYMTQKELIYTCLLEASVIFLAPIGLNGPGPITVYALTVMLYSTNDASPSRTRES